MFDFVRKHTKIMMFLMFLLIIPAFVLVGVDGFRSINGSGETVAVVGSQKISKADWDAVHKTEMDRLRESMPNVDPKLLDSAAARYGTLERMVRDRVVATAIADKHLSASNERLVRLFRDSPEFAGLRKPDGTLNADAYRQLAQREGMSPEMLDLSIRRQLSERQLEGSVPGTAFVPDTVVKTAFNAYNERREVQIASFQPASYSAKVNPTEAEIEAYYQANPVFFKSIEQAKVEVLVLDLESVKKTITINEADLKSYYEQNVGALSGKEERRASHILITAAKTAPEAERSKAREKAQALLDALRKSPDSFAELARKNSQDPGSAAKGGDLDFFARGAMVKPFEDAVFSMKKGELSGLVESDFGFHIIKLTDVKAPKPKTFEELRPTIEAEQLTQLARRKYAEVAEVFSNGVYEQPDDFKAVAEKLKLVPKTVAGVRRSPGPGAEGPLANPKLLAALFAADSIEKKRNTEAVEIGPNQLASARIVEYSPTRTLPLDEVKANVRERLVASRAAEMARQDGAAKLESWKTQKSEPSLSASVVVSRVENSGNVPATVVRAAMHADTSTLPAWVGVDLGSQGYAVVRINKVLERVTPSQADAQKEKVQLGQVLANAEGRAYYEWLKAQYKVEMRVAKPSASEPPAVEGR